MEKADQHIAVCCVFIIASAIIGGCFSDNKQGQNWTMPWPNVHPTNRQRVFVHDSVEYLHHFAIHSWNSSLDGKNFVGVGATMDVYGYNLEPQQQSLSAIWIYITGEGKSPTTGFSVGWHVYPELYNDSETHFVTMWAGNGSPPGGCYNMECTGYIRINSSISPGDVIAPVSSLTGKKQYLTIRAFKDKRSGDWHIYYGFNHRIQLIGYFPKSLFGDMEKKQLIISLGGFASHTTTQASPVMGSGFFPGRNAASFKDLMYINAEGYPHLIDENIPIYQPSPNCYRVTNIEGAMFFYGGPGHCDI